MNDHRSLSAAAPFEDYANNNQVGSVYAGDVETGGDAGVTAAAEPVLPEGDGTEAYRRAAEAGDPASMLNLAVVLAQRGDDAEAERWLRRAAVLGLREAMRELGSWVRASDPAEAQAWYEKAVDLGDVKAMVPLALMVEDKEPQRARCLLQDAATAGSVPAAAELGRMLRNDDPAVARAWYEKAVAGGDPEATHNLAVFIKATDPERARLLWQRAAAQGVAESMYSLGNLARRDDRAEARRWFSQAAALGHKDAMYELGFMALGKGNCVVIMDSPGEARAYFERAAALGHIGAMRALGRTALHSDWAETRRWWELASANGDQKAQDSLRVLSFMESEHPFAHFCARVCKSYLRAMDFLGQLRAAGGRHRKKDA